MTLIEILTDRWISIITRALMILGPMVLIFWIIKPKWVLKFQIPRLNPSKPLWLKEIPRTILGLSVYLIPISTLIFLKQQYGYTKMYTDIDEMGLAYLIFSVFLFLAINDTMFYWSHRWMHSNVFLKNFHAVHHQSITTTPVTSYSFHLVEALINMLPYFLIVLFIPFHPYALLTYAIMGMAYNGYIHLGYDINFQTRQKIPILRSLYSSTHHSIHHQTYNGNYGVYFTFWDRLMKTEVDDSVLRPKSPPSARG